ncbi:hypothetical protein [Lactococcus allomyrinae]|uniref:Uncharacterized protein n=1 Tax=Lactococcus allomyrinae TaxID=2419773 RepID=A0A387BHM6_9LACT|nr:hypothetical protein [Lactococcus allomyrinae]AYG01682.1 hypothetical protein D7I46_11835 [Lactococcus allomyrinae]
MKLIDKIFGRRLSWREQMKLDDYENLARNFLDEATAKKEAILAKEIAESNANALMAMVNNYVEAQTQAEITAHWAETWTRLPGWKNKKTHFVE